MSKGTRELLLRVQTGGRLTIPYKEAEKMGIKEGMLILVKISKAVVTAEQEEKEG